MQPLYLPGMPTLVAYGFLLAFAGMFALLLLSKLETARSRFLAALVIVLLCVGGTVYASEQMVLNPCSQCATADGWLWWALMCWAC